MWNYFNYSYELSACVAVWTMWWSRNFAPSLVTVTANLPDNYHVLTHRFTATQHPPLKAEPRLATAQPPGAGARRVIHTNPWHRAGTWEKGIYSTNPPLTRSAHCSSVYSLHLSKSRNICSPSGHDCNSSWSSCIIRDYGFLHSCQKYSPVASRPRAPAARYICSDLRNFYFIVLLGYWNIGSWKYYYNCFETHHKSIRVLGISKHFVILKGFIRTTSWVFIAHSSKYLPVIKPRASRYKVSDINPCWLSLSSIGYILQHILGKSLDSLSWAPSLFIRGARSHTVGALVTQRAPLRVPAPVQSPVLHKPGIKSFSSLSHSGSWKHEPHPCSKYENLLRPNGRWTESRYIV